MLRFTAAPLATVKTAYTHGEEPIAAMHTVGQEVRFTLTSKPARHSRPWKPELICDGMYRVTLELAHPASTSYSARRVSVLICCHLSLHVQQRLTVGTEDERGDVVR